MCLTKFSLCCEKIFKRVVGFLTDLINIMFVAKYFSSKNNF